MNTENNSTVSNGSSNVRNDAALLTDHSADGIFLHDNRVPFWWKFVFVMSIVFAPTYMLFFHSGIPGRSIYGQYGSQQGEMMKLRFKEIGEDLTADRETILEFLNNKPEWLAVGKVTYQANCATCHGADGGGLVGPNLTDDYWKHVRSVEGIARVLENGAGNGAMPAWKTRFSHPNLIVLTAAYVASLRKNPVAGKGPEGVKVADWNE